MSPYFALLKDYCDTLVRTQILGDDPHFHGGVPCPACHLLHGRVVDTVYPLTLVYHRTGEEKYLTAAVAAVDFAEQNLSRRRGEYRNDALSPWEGPTVFASVALGETLFYHAVCLPSAIREKWESVYARITEFVRVRFFEADFHPNVNYHAAMAAAMALGYRLLGKEVYKTAAYRAAEFVKGHFTQNLILTGEGNGITEKGLRAVDIGYNLEESLPSLTLFAHFLEDTDWTAFVKEAWHAHLDFFLPDGGINNSFGSRHYKWTYYGSRTSDGCQSGLALLAKEDPLLAEAAERNFRLLVACTDKGYLYGGPMYAEAEENPCVHHLIAHAKAVAALVEHDFSHEKRVALPGDETYGLRYFEDLDLAMVAVGEIRATVSAYDYAVRPEAALGGGSPTLLYHTGYGPVFASTMPRYTRFEELNMQLSRTYDKIECGTVRIEQGSLSSLYALDAIFTKKAESGAVFLRAEGRLQDLRRREKGAAYTLSYSFTHEGMTMTALCEEDATFYLPTVCPMTATLSVKDGDVLCSARETTVSLHTDQNFLCPNKEKRIFNPVGGFLYADLSLSLTAGKAVTVLLSTKVKTL